MIAPNDKPPIGALPRMAAARYIGVTTRTLDKYAAAGELPRVKLGAKTVFRIADLDALLAANVQPVIDSGDKMQSIDE